MIHIIEQMDLSKVGPLLGYRRWKSGSIEDDVIKEERIDDSEINQYILDKIKDDPTTCIYFGIDSQVKGKRTEYVIAIVFHSKIRARGAHVIFKSIFKDKFKGSTNDIMQKLTLEAEIVYEEIQRFAKVLMDDGYTDWEKLEMHVDFNATEGTGSNSAYKSHLSWLKSLGLQVHVKPLSYASMAADKVLKPGGSTRRKARRMQRKAMRKNKKRRRKSKKG